jgi:hypothetical protein
MSDQNSPGGDHHRLRTTQNEAGNRPRVDRRLIALDLALVTVMASCSTTRVPPLEMPRVVEQWVDGSVLVGGDGSREHPFKEVPPLVAPLRLKLASGLYRGPFVVGPGVELEGQGEVVLYVERGDGAVVQLRGGTLRHLSVQGGVRGVEVGGTALLEQVHVSGYREVGVWVEPEATATIRRGQLEGTLPDSIAVQVEGATVVMEESRLRGGRRGVQAKAATVTLLRTQAEGVSSLLNAVDSKVVLREVASSAGRGPAFFVAGGSLTLERGQAVGHEYGLQVSNATVDVKRFVSRGALQAGLALSHATGSVAGALVDRAQSGSVQLLDSTLTIDDLEVRASTSFAVLVRQGTVGLTHLRITGVRADGQASGEPVLGDGLQVRDATVTLDEVAVRDTEGSGLYVSAAANVRAKKVLVERAGAAAVVIERGSKFEIDALTVHGAHGPAVLVPDAAQATIGVLDASNVDSACWAECDAGAVVRLTTLSGTAPVFASRCLLRGP